MERTLDRFGRIVIPKKVRDDLGLKAGTVFEIEWTDGTVSLRAVSEENLLVDKGGVLVHRGRPAGPVEDPVKRDREARIQKLLGSGAH